MVIEMSPIQDGDYYVSEEIADDVCAAYLSGEHIVLHFDWGNSDENYLMVMGYSACYDGNKKALYCVNDITVYEDSNGKLRYQHVIVN